MHNSMHLSIPIESHSTKGEFYYVQIKKNQPRCTTHHRMQTVMNKSNCIQINDITALKGVALKGADRSNFGKQSVE